MADVTVWACPHPSPCGCEVALRCVECPLATCKYDVEPDKRREFMYQFRHGSRNALIRAAAAQGARRTEIAAAAGLSERSVYRLIQEAK